MLILCSSWHDYAGPGRIAAFGKAPKGVRAGYRVLKGLHPGAETRRSPDDATFRKRYAAQLRETDGPAVARMMLEVVYLSVPVLSIGDDPYDRDMLGLAAG